MLQTILTALIELVPRLVQVSREALANSLEEMARKVRDGELIPEEAFEQAVEDHEAISNVREKLRG